MDSDFKYSVIGNEIRIDKYVGNQMVVNVPEKIDGKIVTSLDESSFMDLDKITTIILPETLKELGNFAFSGCSNLKLINIPSKITVIPSYCFNNCRSLTNIVLPTNLREIGNNAFRATNLKVVIIPPRVIKIDMFAFYFCQNLRTVTILSEILNTIGTFAFSGCSNLNNIFFPKSLQNNVIIGVGAFEGCENLNASIFKKALNFVKKFHFQYIIPVVLTILFGYENKWDAGGMAATFAIVFLLTFLASKISLKTHIIPLVVASFVVGWAIPSTIRKIYFGAGNKWDVVGVLAIFAIVFLLTFLASKISFKTHIIAIAVAVAVGIFIGNPIAVIVSMLLVYRI